MMLRGVEAQLVLVDLDVGVERADRLLRRVDLRRPRRARCCGSPGAAGWRGRRRRCRRCRACRRRPPRGRARSASRARRRRAAAPCASSSFCWPSIADLLEQQVARVAVALLGAHEARDLDLVAAVLPEREAAGHRLDALVAEILDQRARRPSARAVARRRSRGPRAARGRATTPSMRDSRWLLGTWRAPGRWPVAHSSSSRTSITSAPVCEQLAHGGRVDLVDPVLDLAENLRSRRAHRKTPQRRSGFAC